MAPVAHPARRVRNYTLRRRLWDQVYAALTVGGWPARLAARRARREPLAIEEYTVRAPAGLGDAAELRIAFAADFHAGPSTPHALLERAIAGLAALAPDVILLGGDYVGPHPRDVEPLAAMLASARAPLGTFAVLGNHDYWADADVVAGRLRRAGVELLTNRNLRLPAPFQGVWLCGLDDHTSGTPDADAAFAGAGAVRVLLMHAPSGLLDVGARPFTVALCGHTHGGQVTFPNGRPLIVAHGPLSRRYNAGRFDLTGGGTLIVTRGVGYGTLPLRVNAPAGIVLCRLIAPAPRSADASETDTPGRET